MGIDNFDALIFIGLGVIFLTIMVYVGVSKDKFTTFDNADYQYDPAPITVQNNYYKGIQNECGGNTYDYNCLEKVHLKAFRGDMENLPTAGWDAQTHVCMSSRNVVDEESLYKCLDGTYADYRYP